MNSIGYFEIQSSDPERDVAFYKAIFDWAFIRQPQIPIVYYLIETPGIGGGLLQRPSHIPLTGSGTNAYVCSIEVDNFDKYGALILQHGGQVAMAKFAIPGRCWQGYFLDPDGNTFGVFEVNAEAK